VTLPPLAFPSRQLIVPTRCLRCGRWRTRRRYAPRDRLRQRLLNVGSGLQISSTGIVVTAQGLLVTDGTETSSATCCCTGPTGDGAPCSSCDVTPPAQFDLVFDGLTQCTQCDATAGPHSFRFTAGDPNGTFRVTQDTGPGGAGPCVWKGDGASGFGVKEWASSFCTGTVESDQTGLGPSKIVLTRENSTQFSIDYWLPYSNAFWFDPRFFQRRTALSSSFFTMSCLPTAPHSENNGNTSCPFSSFARGASGGTVTITPV
jgi:hypothetical protein